MKTSRFSFWIVLGAIILGALIGASFGKDVYVFKISLYSIFDIGGQLFIQALMLVVLPLITSSIISGIADFTKEYSLKKLGIKIFSIFLSLNFLALLVGAFFIYFFFPQIQSSATSIYEAAKHLLPQMKQTATATAGLNISNLILQIIPSNIIEAFYHGRIIGLIFFSLLFGIVIGQIEAKPATVLREFWNGVFQVMIKITTLILKFLPLGVFFLVAKQFALTGFQALQPLAFFLLIVLGALFFFALIILPLILKFVGRVQPTAHFKYMMPALVTAFSTSSSTATIPISMHCLEKKIGVSKRLGHLIIPLGATLNMAGSALYSFIAVIFIASAFKMVLSFSIILSIFLYTLVITLGVASVPSSALFVIILILQSLNLPAEGIALIVAVDRLIDMFRTATNVFTCSCSTVLIAKMEGEKIRINKK